MEKILVCPCSESATFSSSCSLYAKYYPHSSYGNAQFSYFILSVPLGTLSTGNSEDTTAAIATRLLRCIQATRRRQCRRKT